MNQKFIDNISDKDLLQTWAKFIIKQKQYQKHYYYKTNTIQYSNYYKDLKIFNLEERETNNSKKDNNNKMSNIEKLIIFSNNENSNNKDADMKFLDEMKQQVDEENKTMANNKENDKLQLQSTQIMLEKINKRSNGNQQKKWDAKTDKDGWDVIGNKQYYKE